MKKDSLFGKTVIVAGAGFILATANASALVGVNATTAVTTSVGVKATTSVSASVTTGTDAGMMDTGTVQGSGSVSGVVAPAAISSDAELKAYTTSIQTTQDSVSDIDTDSNNSVSVSWKHPAKLFGFIPVSISSKTTVSAAEDNTVKVVTELPWWNIFVSGINASTWAQADLKLQQSNEVKANMKANASAEAKSEVVHAVVSQLKLEAEATAKVQAGN